MWGVGSINRILVFIGRNAMVAMVIGVFIGLLTPPLATLMRPLLAPSVWLLLVISLLRVNTREGLAHLSKPRRLVLLLFSFLVILPIGMQGLLSLTPLPSGLIGAMVLTAGSSVLISTSTLALLMGLDGAMILLIMLGTTLLMPVTLPIVALGLLGLELEMSSWELMGRLVFLVGSAVILATLGRRVIGEARLKTQAEVLDGAAVVTLVIFAIAIMDGLAARLMAEPGYVLFVIAVSFMVYTGLIILMTATLATIVPQWGRRLQLSVGLASGARNLGVILAVMPANADPDMLLYFAAGQFPIYIMPAVLKPIMLRLNRRETT